MACRSWRTGAECVFAVPRDYSLSVQNARLLSESADLMDLAYQVEDIQEKLPKSLSSAIPAPQRTARTRPDAACVPVPTFRNELTEQLIGTRRSFVLLGRRGSHDVLKLRPIDVLNSILSGTASSDNDRGLALFFERYGSIQACAMCLSICCSPEATQHTQAAAERALFRNLRPQQASQQQAGQRQLVPNSAT
jgi:hypothetical protein